MPQEHGLSICVTTQVGCVCVTSMYFCASGIIANNAPCYWGNRAQVMHVRTHFLRRSVSWDRVSHIVAMGIGGTVVQRLITMITWLNSWKWSTLIKTKVSGLAIYHWYLQVVWLSIHVSSQTKDYKWTLHCPFMHQIPINALVSCVSTVNIQLKSWWMRD